MKHLFKNIDNTPRKADSLARLFSPKAKPDTDLAIEQLEPRVLFSAAPVDADAPADIDAADAPAQEAPAVVEAQAQAEANPVAQAPAPVAAPQASEPDEAVPAAPGAGEISETQSVVLVDVNDSTSDLNEEAEQAAKGPSEPLEAGAPRVSRLLLGTESTSVIVDSDGNLVIEDILGGDTDDRLFIGMVDGRLEVRDSRNTVGTSITDAIELGNRGRGVSIALTSFSGDIIVRMQGGDDRITVGDLDGLPKGITIEDGDGQDRISQKGTVNLSGNARLTYAAEQIRLERRSSLATEDGKITLDGNVDQTSTRRSIGIWANGSRISSDAGPIEITGFGGAKGSANRGVYLKNTEITSASGDIEITGNGGGTGNSNDGIYLARGTAISSHESGWVSMEGTGGHAKNSNRGIYVQSGVSISAEEGGLYMYGTGGAGKSGNMGIVAGRAEFSTTNSGSMQVKGWGTGTTSRNGGTQLKGTTLIADGDGKIEVLGSSSQGFTGSGNVGLDMRSARISTVDGDISVKAYGGRGTNANLSARFNRTDINSQNGNVSATTLAVATSTGSRNGGADFSRGSISAGGDISVSAQGSKGTNHNVGLRLNRMELTAGGNATLTGTVRSETTGSNNRGMEVRHSSITGEAINLDGTGGGGIHRNNGVYLHNSSLLARTGSIGVTGEALASTTGSNNVGVEVKASRIQSAGDTVIAGTSGGGLSHNHGVRMTRTSIEAGPGNNVDIYGEARNSTEASGNIGVHLRNGVSLRGNQLLMTGIGGGGTELNHGIFADRDIVDATTNNTIIGTAGAGEESEDTHGDFFE